LAALVSLRSGDAAVVRRAGRQDPRRRPPRDRHQHRSRCLAPRLHAQAAGRVLRQPRSGGARRLVRGVGASLADVLEPQRPARQRDRGARAREDRRARARAGRPRPMIVAEQLRKRFGLITAVDGVSLRAEDGRITGLLGPNGAGKTTTLRLLYGLMKPDAGTVTIDDVDVVADPLAAQARVGVLPDAHGLYPRLSAREHIRYFGELQGLRGAALAQRVDALIERLDMR